MDSKTGWTRRLLATALAALLTLTAAFSQAEETITYIHWDAQGSPVAATDQDGNVVWRVSYRPYGERINHQPAAGPHTRWYTGHPQDEDTGLIYAGARYYDPVVGRFLAVDPVEFQEDNLHSFNRYAYGSNNPYRYVDPNGRESTDVGCLGDGCFADALQNPEAVDLVGPKLQEPTNGFENLLPQNAVLSGLCGDLGLVDEEWPMAGTSKGWERSDWPLPPFYREDEDANRAWLTYYDEDTLDFIREEPIEPQQHSAYPYDRVMGYGSVEIRLTKLLSM